MSFKLKHKKKLTKAEKKLRIERLKRLGIMAFSTGYVGSVLYSLEKTPAFALLGAGVGAYVGWKIAHDDPEAQKKKFKKSKRYRGIGNLALYKKGKHYYVQDDDGNFWSYHGKKELVR